MAEAKKEPSTEGTTGAFEVREDMVFEFMKELFAFGYGAAERMEERATEFAKMRRERMEEFRKDREQMQAKLKSKIDERAGDVTAPIKKQVMSVMRETGVATQDEVEELKAMIAAMNEKLDKLTGGEAKKPK